MSNIATVRMRMGPSPTGYPHIGTIYQALFNMAYARKWKGSFIIRIEDTDRGRYVADAEEKLYRALDWFKIKEDESVRMGGEYGPYRQSDRLGIYKYHVEKLIEDGHAYRCFCTRERLDDMRARMIADGKPPMYDRHCRTLNRKEVDESIAKGIPHVVRMKIPSSQTVTFYDGIRGNIAIESHTVDDQIILKSDGYPTYHLAVVVDDHLMKITHVMRGEEWLISTPKHVLLYDYFGWERPRFFHTPALRNPDRSKLSKRHGHADVQWYCSNGYLPEAILNFIALMGWSHPDEKEIFDLHEFINLFDLSDIKAVGPVFDLQKLNWMNGEYIRNMPENVLFSHIMDFYRDKGYDAQLVKKTIPLIQERIKTLTDYESLCAFFFHRPDAYEIDLCPYHDVLQNTREALQTIDTWDPVTIGEAMQSVAKVNEMKNSEFFMMLRVVVTGKKVSPPLNDSMHILGKQECVERISEVL